MIVFRVLDHAPFQSECCRARVLKNLCKQFEEEQQSENDSRRGTEVGGHVGLPTGSWADLLHPIVAGFYVPLLLALAAGAMEAHAASRTGSRVGYSREHFVVGSELCLGSISIVVLAAIHFAYSSPKITLESFIRHPSAPMLVPMLVVNAWALYGTFWLRRYAVRNAPVGSRIGHTASGQLAKGRRIPLVDIFVSLFVCAALVSLNALLFQQQ